MDISLSDSGNIPPDAAEVRSLHRFGLPVSSDILLLTVSASENSFPDQTEMHPPENPVSSENLYQDDL